MAGLSRSIIAVKRCPPGAPGIDRPNLGWPIKAVAMFVVWAVWGYRLTDRLRILTEVPWSVPWIVNRATAVLINKMPR